MTDKITSDVTPTTRTAAATAARMRKSEAKWADHLRGRGWTVVPPAALEAMEEIDADTFARMPDWCRGFRDGIRAVAAVSANLLGR